MKEYSVTFSSMLGLTIVTTFLSILCLLLGIYTNEVILMLIGILIFFLLLGVRFKFKVRFDEHELSSSGFISTKTLNWKEIRKVINSMDFGYPRERYYGPYVYEFQSSNDKLLINFKLFPKECMLEILSKAKGVINEY